MLKLNCRLVLVFSLLLMVFSCKEEEVVPFNSNTCDDLINDLPSMVFTGRLYFCDQNYSLPASAVGQVNDSLLEIRIVTDTMFLDTLLRYKYDCVVPEGYAIIRILDEDLRLDGHMGNERRSARFTFNNSKCHERHNHALFEGRVD